MLRGKTSQKTNQTQREYNDGEQRIKHNNEITRKFLKTNGEMVKRWALSKPGFHSDLRKLNLLIGNKTAKEGVRFAMLSHQKPRILWLAPQKAKNYPPSKKWDFSLVDLKMVKEEGLVVVGERHTKETVIQDCNSYIKVILLSILEATNIIRDVFTISSS